MKSPEKLANDLFFHLIKEDKWINQIANSTKCYDKHSIFKYYKTCSYPVEYVVTEEQISKAKELCAIRKAEIISFIEKGELVFCAMGGYFKSQLDNGVGNYRIGCYFLNKKGHKYFIELCTSCDGENRIYIDFSIDEELKVIRQEEVRRELESRREVNGKWGVYEKQDYYNCFGIEKTTIEIPFTFDNVLKLINDTYGCCYKSSRLVRYFASYEDWCCYC